MSRRRLRISALLISLLLHLLFLLLVSSRESRREITTSVPENAAVEMVFAPSPKARRLVPAQPEGAVVDALPPETENISEQNTVARDRTPGGDDLVTPHSPGESPVPELIAAAKGAPGTAETEPAVDTPQSPESAPAEPADAMEPGSRSPVQPEDVGGRPSEISRPPPGTKYLREPGAAASGGPAASRATMTLAAAEANAAGQGDLSLSTYAWRWVPYMRTVKARIEKNLHPPAAFSQLGIIEGTTRIQFRIHPDGSVEGPGLVKSSSQQSLDEASLHSVRASSPFPPLPDDFPDDHLDIVFTYYYRIPDWARPAGRGAGFPRRASPRGLQQRSAKR